MINNITKSDIISYVMSLPRVGASPDAYVDFTDIPDDAVFTLSSITTPDNQPGYEDCDVSQRIARKCKCPVAIKYFTEVYSNPVIPPIVIVDGVIFDGNHRVSYCNRNNITTIPAYIYKRT